jgi:D-sedoheptulose 7-phosphate isomerase
MTANVAEAKAVLQQLLELEGQVEAASAIIAEALLSGRKLLACGNGGSAADASHLTTEFVVRYDRERRAYPAISLASHGGDLTAIGNDYSFADLFARQVQAYGQPGDVMEVVRTRSLSPFACRAQGQRHVADGQCRSLGSSRQCDGSHAILSTRTFQYGSA